MQSSTATSSALVELQVFNSCLVDAPNDYSLAQTHSATTVASHVIVYLKGPIDPPLQ